LTSSRQGLTFDESHHFSMNDISLLQKNPPRHPSICHSNVGRYILIIVLCKAPALFIGNFAATWQKWKTSTFEVLFLRSGDHTSIFFFSILHAQRTLDQTDDRNYAYMHEKELIRGEDEIILRSMLYEYMDILLKSITYNFQPLSDLGRIYKMIQVGFQPWKSPWNSHDDKFDAFLLLAAGIIPRIAVIINERAKSALTNLNVDPISIYTTYIHSHILLWVCLSFKIRSGCASSVEAWKKTLNICPRYRTSASGSHLNRLKDSNSFRSPSQFMLQLEKKREKEIQQKT
jgi:hypothetical protein